MKIKYTKLQYALEALCLLLIGGMVVYLCIRWSGVPDRLPSHYNFAGEVDRWGNKRELLILPCMNILLYLLITPITFFPQIWNMPKSITEENKERVYTSTRTLLILVRIETILIFNVMTYFMLESKELPIYFLPVTLVILFGTVGYFIWRIIKLGK